MSPLGGIKRASSAGVLIHRIGRAKPRRFEIARKDQRIRVVCARTHGRPGLCAPPGRHYGKICPAQPANRN
jgi:hypothetical protein